MVEAVDRLVEEYRTRCLRFPRQDYYLALTRLQRAVCRLPSDNRVASGESDVGGVALNELIAATRRRVGRALSGLAADLREALDGGRIAFHHGRIRRALPQIKP